MIGAQSIWENGDELPSRFLERSRLGRPLPCAIRLRTQRSDHMAVGWDGMQTQIRNANLLTWITLCKELLVLQSVCLCPHTNYDSDTLSRQREPYD